MKAIQITLDEWLLSRLDADAEVKRFGRSAVLRRAAIEYLRRSHRKRIAEAYTQAYGSGISDQDLDEWPQEGTWPEE